MTSARQTGSLDDAGIESFAFEADGVHARMANGELATSEQSFAGEVISERWQTAEEGGTEIGILHDTEDGTHELYAAHTHDYTGEEGHTHGGEMIGSEENIALLLAKRLSMQSQAANDEA